MNNFKKSYGYVLQNIKKNKDLINSTKSIQNKTFVISGGTRGIGFNIAEKLILNGANVAILGKTKEPHPKLENTIDSAVLKLQQNSINNKKI